MRFVLEPRLGTRDSGLEGTFHLWKRLRSGIDRSRCARRSETNISSESRVPSPESRLSSESRVPGPESRNTMVPIENSEYRMY
jgi:hypothetical protein